MATDQIAAALSQEFADLPDAAAATSAVLRLVLAAALGGVLGFEREAMGKSAGLRTHMLVALGSALVVLVPSQLAADDQAVSRVIQGVVAGIGFLGAGAIVKGRPGDEIVGLTTAATVWTTAAIGMAAGLGRGLTAIVAALLALFILRVLPSGGAPGAEHKS